MGGSADCRAAPSGFDAFASKLARFTADFTSAGSMPSHPARLRM